MPVLFLGQGTTISRKRILLLRPSSWGLLAARADYGSCRTTIGPTEHEMPMNLRQLDGIVDGVGENRALVQSRPGAADLLALGVAGGAVEDFVVVVAVFEEDVDGALVGVPSACQDIEVGDGSAG